MDQPFQTVSTLGRQPFTAAPVFSARAERGPIEAGSGIAWDAAPLQPIPRSSDRGPIEGIDILQDRALRCPTVLSSAEFTYWLF